MELESVIRDRYSVRKFKDDKVSEELLKKLMEISVLAPSAKNVQPLHILTLTSDDALRKINEASPCIYNAPVVFVVCYDKNNVFNLSNGTNSGSEDASIIATHIMLEATNLGLGTCWINMFDEDKIR
jgi:nitroreductase